MILDGVKKSMNDFLAKTPTLEKLEKRLRQFFDNYKELGVKISTKKFKASMKVRFGGTIVNSEGKKTFLEADPGKLKRILDFPAPNNKDELLSFLGLIKNTPEIVRWSIPHYRKHEGTQEGSQHKELGR